MEDTLILVWIFSCVFAWGFTGSATPLGETIIPVYFRNLVRSFGYMTSVIAIITTAILLPRFIQAIQETGSGMTTFHFLFWSTIHLAGAIYTVGSFNYRLATRPI